MAEFNPNDSAILCERLTRHYGEVKAVQELDLSVPYGSVFGFLGRNGAGKTTTIRMLTGLTHPTSGRAWVAGIETTSSDSSARRAFGYLPQSPSFYNWMTPQEYLDYSARLYGLEVNDTQSRIREVLALVGLEKAKKRRIGGFSGGMLQRLGIAQAMVHRPPVVMLDEPTSALDPAGRYEVLDLIDHLRGQVTVFLSSHILTDIERVCDTVAIIREGVLVLRSGRDELLELYATQAVELELEHGQAFPPAFVAAACSQTWFSGKTQENSTLRLSVNNLEQAKQELLPLVAQYGLALNRYEWVHPTLEEIFLKVSA